MIARIVTVSGLILSSPCACVFAMQSEPISLPAPLVACEEARKGWQGRLEWRVEVKREDPRSGASSSRTFISHYAANGDWSYQESAPWAGVPGGRPVVYFRNADGDWFHPIGGSHASWWPETGDTELDQKAKDLRWVAIGVGTVGTMALVPRHGLKRVMNSPNHPIERWEETTREGDTYVVRGTASSGGVFTFWVDSARGWNVTKATFEIAHLRSEMIAELDQVDGVWLPVSSRYYSDGKLVTTIEILGASMGDAAAPPSLDLGYFGAEPGVQIVLQNGELPPNLQGPGGAVWNGEELTSWEQWKADVDRGLRRWGPTFEKSFITKRWEGPYEPEHARSAAELTQRDLHARVLAGERRGFWRKYVEEFIVRFQLDDSQKEKAFQVLTECEEHANEYLTRKQSAIREAVSEQRAAREAGDASRSAKVEERIRGLLGPLDDIFEKRLKPKLERIPTREQLLKAAMPSSPDAPATGKPRP